MKELFDRYQERLTEAEDRRVWGGLYDEVKRGRPTWRRWGVPLGAVATVAAVVWTMTVRMNVSAPPVPLAEKMGPYVVQQVPADLGQEESLKQPGTRTESVSPEEFRSLPAQGAGTGGEDAKTGERPGIERAPVSDRDRTPVVVTDDIRKNARGKLQTGPAAATNRQVPASSAEGVDRNERGASSPVVGQDKRDVSAPHRTSGAVEQEVSPEAPRSHWLAQKVEKKGKEADVSQVQGRIASPNPETMPQPVPPQTRPGEPIPVGGTDPVNGVVYDAMFFEHYGVNPFVDPLDDRFATFAVDVDNASYTLTRNYLSRNVLPPKDAVRVEEFVNAFDHHYAAPEHVSVASSRRRPISKHGTFAIHLDAAPSPFGERLVLMRVGLKGREVHPFDRKPAVLTFVIDVSGSMERENRLELVKRALFLLLDQMNEEDEVALVVYGTNARTILSHATLRERRMIESAITSLRPEGATNAEAGLGEAYLLAQRNFRDGYINRVILCSDGVANVGRTGAEGILEVIRNEAGRGIYLTTVGFGMGNYNDVLMEKLANQGEGNYYYVDGIDEAEKVFVENLTGTLQTIARQVKIQVEFDPDRVRRYRLLGYENRDVADRDFRNDAVDAGEVGAGHEVTALFEVKLEKNADRGDLATVRIRYEDPESARVTEEMQTFRVEDIRNRITDTDPTFRMDAAVAEFAEILRHSYWAKEGRLRDVLDLAREASRAQGDPQELVELCRLVDTADRLWDRAPAPTWREDVRPAWTPEDDDPRRR